VNQRLGDLERVVWFRDHDQPWVLTRRRGPETSGLVGGQHREHPNVRQEIKGDLRREPDRQSHAVHQTAVRLLDIPLPVDRD
jgi:hypothetical protein